MHQPPAPPEIVPLSQHISVVYIPLQRRSMISWISEQVVAIMERERETQEAAKVAAGEGRNIT